MPRTLHHLGAILIRWPNSSTGSFQCGWVAAVESHPILKEVPRDPSGKANFSYLYVKSHSLVTTHSSFFTSTDWYSTHFTGSIHLSISLSSIKNKILQVGQQLLLNLKWALHPFPVENYYLGLGGAYSHLRQKPHTQLQNIPVQAEGHELMKLTAWSPKSRDETTKASFLYPVTAHRNSIHKYYEEKLWQNASSSAQFDLLLAIQTKLSQYKDQKWPKTTKANWTQKTATNLPCAMQTAPSCLFQE